MYRFYLSRFSALNWRQRLSVIGGLTVAIALAIGLIILSLTLALILLPVVAIALFVARLRLNRALAEAARRGDQPSKPGVRVIDAEFEVVDDNQRDDSRRG